MILQRPNQTEIETTSITNIPEGVYNVQILHSKIESYSSGTSAIVLAFDICEGEYKNYFTKKNEADKTAGYENNKFKGLLQIFFPRQNTPNYEKDYKKFWKSIYAIESFNDNFLFADTDKIGEFVGKKACILICKKDYEYNGKCGVTVKPHGFINKETLQTGKWKNTMSFIHSKLKYTGNNTPMSQNNSNVFPDFTQNNQTNNFTQTSVNTPPQNNFVPPLQNSPPVPNIIPQQATMQPPQQPVPNQQGYVLGDYFEASELAGDDDFPY